MKKLLLTVVALFSITFASDLSDARAEVDMFNEETLEAIYDGDSVAVDIIVDEAQYLQDEYGVGVIIHSDNTLEVYPLLFTNK